MPARPFDAFYGRHTAFCAHTTHSLVFLFELLRAQPAHLVRGTAGWEARARRRARGRAAARRRRPRGSGGAGGGEGSTHAPPTQAHSPLHQVDP